MKEPLGLLWFKRIFFSLWIVAGLFFTIISYDSLSPEANMVMHLTAAAVLAIGAAQVNFTFEKKK